MAKDNYLQVFHEEPGWPDSGTSGPSTLPVDRMESLGGVWRGQNRQLVRLSARALFSELLERLVWWSRFRVTPTLGRIRCRLLLLTKIPRFGIWKSESIRTKVLTRLIQFRDDVVARGARLTSLSAHGRDGIRRTRNPHVHNCRQHQPHKDHVRSMLHDVPLVFVRTVLDRSCYSTPLPWHHNGTRSVGVVSSWTRWVFVEARGRGSARMGRSPHGWSC